MAQYSQVWLLRHKTQHSLTHSPRGRIDQKTPCVLASFVEPLDALLEVEEIQDVRSHFEDMVQHIVRTVQEHFHLQRPAGDRQTSGSSQLDTLHAQRVQQTYKWNRRKCIRAITDGATTRCPVGMEDTYNHFRAIWESPSPSVERTDVTPPPRSPVVDSLTQAFVEICLKTAENSSPGQDFITYRHWRDIAYMPEAGRHSLYLENFKNSADPQEGGSRPARKLETDLAVGHHIQAVCQMHGAQTCGVVWEL
ncbi:uncharacterized protein TNCV_1429081 [Trichonephila clavipes]|nr:uncharacterized protein TNCV_1429081 [Trichonephila clavipes]